MGEEIPKKEREIKEAAKQALNNAKSKAVDTIENAMNHLAPVKTRTIARMKQLEKASKWKHEKQIIMGHVEWKDTPPRELIGDLSMGISGGIGKISYVRYLKDPETNQALKQASPDGLEMGGNIISHYVQEIIEPAQKIKREIIPVKGCPSVEEAKKKMKQAREYERRRVMKARGLE